MGYIYKITNKINNKMYIGQTITTIKERMYKHYSNAKKATTGIDFAIGKYGKENFIVEEVCSCLDEDLDDLEQFYIAKFDTYNNGYNLTIGGQKFTTALNLNEQEVISKYLEIKNVNKTAEYFKCCNKVISRILHKNNIKVLHNNNIQNLTKEHCFKENERIKAIKIIELDKDFPSLKECAQWLIDNNYSKANSMEMARKSLSRALTGERKSYCKLHFKYL